MDLKTYLSDYLANDEDYEVFVDLLGVVFNDIKSVVDNMNNITDVDNCTDLFLPKLSALVSYKFDYSIDTSVQRDMIKRMVWLYQQKGRDQDIINAATHGDNPKWVGSTLFYPDALLETSTAEVIHPTDIIFRHSVSAHSGTHRFADSTRYRDGTIIVRLSTLNDAIREAVKKIVPAGIRVFYEVSGSTGSVVIAEMGEWVLTEDYEIDYILRLHDNVRSSTFDGNLRNYQNIRSGLRLLFEGYEFDILKGSSMLPTEPKPGSIYNDITYPVRDVDTARKHRGDSKRSYNAVRSGKYAFDGSYLGEITKVIEIDEVVPNDVWYPVSAVLNLKPGEYLKFYNTEVEVEISADPGPIIPPESPYYPAVRSVNAERDNYAVFDGEIK